MKLTFEIHGYSITIDETEEGVTVAASKDDETVEEFTLDIGDEGEEFDGEEMPEGGEEEMPEGGEEEMPEGQEEPEEDFETPAPQGQLESFNSFIKKRG